MPMTNPVRSVGRSFGFWLLAVGCWLLAVGCWLLAVGCWLLAAWMYQVSPSGCAEEQSGQRTRACDCLSACKARVLEQNPGWTRAPQVARSEAKGRRQSGRLSLGIFSLARQRKGPRPPGRFPACALSKGRALHNPGPAQPSPAQPSQAKPHQAKTQRNATQFAWHSHRSATHRTGPQAP